MQIPNYSSSSGIQKLRHGHTHNMDRAFENDKNTLPAGFKKNYKSSGHDSYCTRRDADKTYVTCNYDHIINGDRIRVSRFSDIQQVTVSDSELRKSKISDRKHVAVSEWNKTRTENVTVSDSGSSNSKISDRKHVTVSDSNKYRTEYSSL